MSLNWNIERIANHKEVCWIADPKPDNPDNARLNPVTETLIFATITVGLGSITEKNVSEFAARFRIAERLDGPFLYKAGEDGNRVDWLLSDEDFIAHIGLYTNVSNETRAAWAARYVGAKPNSKTSDFKYTFERNRDKVAA
jgi:hypothetical protein